MRLNSCARRQTPGSQDPRDFHGLKAKRTAFVEGEIFFGVRRLLFGLATPNGPHKANKAILGKILAGKQNFDR
jgi:hypothetical protein